MEYFRASFPSGVVGIGLLLLRMAVAILLLTTPVAIIGRAFTATPHENGTGAFVGLATTVCSALMLIGLMARVVPVVALLILFTFGLGFWPDWPGAAVAALLAISVALVGPGAYSIDALRSGRREIVIPPASSERPNAEL